MPTKKRVSRKKKPQKRQVKVMFDKHTMLFKQGGKDGEFNSQVDLKAAADREPEQQVTKRFITFLVDGQDPRAEGWVARYYYEVCKFMPSRIGSEFS